jgi:DNA repair protein RecN (Recombination protein N)
MLAQLSIRDIVLIERLDISFGSGLSVLTGETGAGKSILLDALSLALGARGDGSLVRAGCEQGQVTAAFDPPMDHPARRLLSQNSIDPDDMVILRRVQGADGRTRAFVNDAPVSASLLREVGAALVEIHGQHDARALVDAASHRMLLDAFGGLTAPLQATGEAWDSWQKCRKELAALVERAAASAREAEYLRASVEELRKLDPRPGEEMELADRRTQMMRAEKIAGELNEAHETLAGNASPLPTISSLLRRLERKAADGPQLLQQAVAQLGAGLDGLLQAQQSLEQLMRDSEFDPRVLESTEERLFALRAAARKFHVPADDLAAKAARMEADLELVDAGTQRIGELRGRETVLAAAYTAAAQRLGEARRSAAAELEKAVANELPALKLENARFLVSMEPLGEGGPQGMERIEFHVRTNPGTPAGPLGKIASGGELSRFLLALKVALADRGSAPTLVFDEIDTGAGGAVADAIGRRLERLSRSVQVLSVTHAPQVAARAEGHFLIRKDLAPGDSGERMATAIGRIAGEERREEIARMLSGATITAEARAAAEKLIASAG